MSPSCSGAENAAAYSADASLSPKISAAIWMTST
jgi:hypothetical protein